MGAPERTERFEMRMTVAELDMLQALATSDGLTNSDVVRLLVRRAHAERFGGEKRSRGRR